MNKLKILDCDAGCGGFSKGFEDTNKFRVTCNPLISDENLFCYNSSHHNNFVVEGDNENQGYDLLHYAFDNKKDSLSKKYSFSENDFNMMLLFLSLHTDIDNIFITLKNNVFFSIQNSDSISFVNKEYPVRDRLVSFLNNLGYNVFYYVYDCASFGLPQHVIRMVYFATKKDVVLKKLEDVYTRFDNPFNTVIDCLGDIRNDSVLSWHDVDFSKKEICSLIEPGSNARNTKGVVQKAGYNRLPSGFLDSHLSYDFYTFSSSFPSIHPVYARPLTIREGARLFGLSDVFDWDKDFVTKKRVARMIYESFYPELSKMIADKVYSLLK